MNIKKMSIGLLAVLLTVPAFAQAQQDSIKQATRPGNMMDKKTMLLAAGFLLLGISTDSQVKVTKDILTFEKAVERTAFKKAVQAKQAQEADSLPTCVYCGEQFNPALHEHCSATGNTGLHAASAPQNGNEGSAAPASVCPKCHQTLSIDERFHGVPHNCPADTADSLPTCVYCGEKFNPLHHEHCAATGNTGLHAASAPQNGNEGSAAPASVCPKCHQTLSIDERFHGVPHNCPADTASSAASLPTCVYCGEPFNPALHEHCAATGYTGLHAVASSQNDNEGASSPVRRCPECGKELTLDEIYHNTHTHYCIKCGKEFEGRSNPDCSVSGKCTIQCPECGMNLRDEQNLVNGTHHCKFKGRYTPVAPVK